MLQQFQKIERPENNGNSAVEASLVEAIAKTQEDGSAIQVKLKPEVNYINWRQNLRNQLMKRNLKMRMKFDSKEKVATVWVDPVNTSTN